MSGENLSLLGEGGWGAATNVTKVQTSLSISAD